MANSRTTRFRDCFLTLAMAMSPPRTTLNIEEILGDDDDDDDDDGRRGGKIMA